MAPRVLLWKTSVGRILDKPDDAMLLTIGSTITLFDLVFFVSQGKVHGSLARAGKVKSHTPKVEKQEKRKKKTGE
jgi:hypothetical protein